MVKNPAAEGLEMSIHHKHRGNLFLPRENPLRKTTIPKFGKRVKFIIMKVIEGDVLLDGKAYQIRRFMTCCWWGSVAQNPKKSSFSTWIRIVTSLAQKI